MKGPESERKSSKKIVKATSAKTPKRKQRGDSFASSDPAVPSSDRRRSGRATVQKSYIESSDEEALDDVVENGDEDMPDASEAESELSPAPEAEAELLSEPEPEPALPTRKGRGRAKKTEPKLPPAPEEATSGLSPEPEPALPIRKGRGRAKKAESELSPEPEQEAAPPAKKGRGKEKKAEPLAEQAEQEKPVSEPKLEPQVVRSPRITRKREVPVVAVSDDESSSLLEEEEDADSLPPKSASRKKATPKKTNGSTGRKEKAEKVAPAPVKAKTPVRPMPKTKPTKKVPAANTNGRATRGQKTKEVGLYDVPSDSN